MPPPIEIPTHVPVGVITSFTGLPERTVRQWAVEGKVPKSIPGVGYPFLETVTAIREVVEAKGEPTDIQRDRAAKLKAERISAEMDAAEKQGEMLPRKDVEAVWSDAWAKTRMVISGFDPLSDADKALLIENLLAVKLDNPTAAHAA